MGRGGFVQLYSAAGNVFKCIILFYLSQHWLIRGFSLKIIFVEFEYWAGL